jgi:hypothetical protein
MLLLLARYPEHFDNSYIHPFVCYCHSMYHDLATARALELYFAFLARLLVLSLSLRQLLGSLA